MSGSSSKQTTTTSSQPYKAAAPLLDKGMGDALSLYNQGSLVRPNTMSTVVPFSQQTTLGMNELTDLANRNLGGSGLTNNLQHIINQGGFSNDQMTALNGIRQTATTPFDINANPAYASIRQRAMDAASEAANSTAAGLGRYGSGTHQGVLAREVGNVAGNLDFQQFNNHMARQDAAQDRLFNAGQTGQGNMTDAFGAISAPSDMRMRVGGMSEDLFGRNLNDQLRVANELQNLPLANIQALLGVASGAGNFGSQKQTAQGPSSGFSNILGAGLGGLSLLGAL